MYDHILTLHEEVNLVWSRKFNIVSWLFLINRYFTLVKMAMLFQNTWADSMMVSAA